VLVRAEPDRLPALLDSLIGRGVEPASVVVLGLDTADTRWRLYDLIDHRGVGFGFTSIGDDSVLSADARAALVAYGLRRYGAGRVFLGTGMPIVRVRPAEPAELADPSAALDRFRELLTGLGITSEQLEGAMSTSAARLFAPGEAIND
jgi:hypothetical protein